MRNFTLLVVGWLAALPAFAAAEPEVGCAYQPRATAGNPQPEVTFAERCGRELSDGTAEIERDHLAAMDFDRQGLAAVRLGEHFYYLRRDGTSARVVAYDNWADDFAEGRVRTQRTVAGAEKIGYLDHELRSVVAPRYDWGFPFEGGRALVCNGCRPGAPDADGHRVVSGGLWGYIDRAGREVVPLRYSREELLKRSDRP